MSEFHEALARFERLVIARMEIVPAVAIRSLYRAFMDLEPVWSGMLSFNYIFSIGAPYSGPPSTAVPQGTPPLPRGPTLRTALGIYQDTIPDILPVGETFYITNVLDYARKIEDEGGPSSGYGQGALAAAAAAWPRHVKLGVAAAVAEVRP